VVRIRGRLFFLMIAKSISWETYTTQFFIPTLLAMSSVDSHW
jgi:hypothetical protein